ncbi:MAG: NAD+ synthase [Desulfomonile tiedjei]|nr:NAD+ synthase [Desulfomonile tiedjei]
MASLRVAQAQVNTTVGNFRENLEKIRAWADRARTEAVDIVTFPELALCGYPPEDLLIKPGFLRANLAALDELVRHCRGINLIVGFAHRVNGKVYNAAALISDGALIDVYHKIELPNYGVFDEKRYFVPGSSCLVFDLAGALFSVTICEDIWIPGSDTESCATKNGADFVLNISGSPYHAGKLILRRAIVARFAAATGTTVFYNNLVGGQDELVFDGGSMVVDSKGTLLSSAAMFEEDLLVTDIEITPAPRKNRPWNMNGPIRALPPADASVRKPVTRSITLEVDRIEEIYKALVLGTRDYVRKNGFRNVVIGLSGGIDSSLVAAVAVDALGSEHVVGVTMPSQYTSNETFSDAGHLAANLNMRLITVPVKDILGSYFEALEEPFREGTPCVEGENLQARIRGNILMALSNRFGFLVLTTGNKSETAVGYSTLYGDTAGGFAVIKDVPKTLVYELAAYVNKKAGKDIIPRSVIERPPSAELRPDQKDEDSLPPYEVLDPILKAYVEEDKAPDEIESFDPDLVREVVRMVDRNEYKRRQAPPGVKITPKAFGRDRRLPITNQYRSGSK